MGENNNKPIGFTGYLGPYARSLSTGKNSIWGVPIGNSVRPDPGRPVHLVWRPYGVCCGVPAAPDEVLEQMFESAGGTHFRENVRRARTRGFCEKN